MNPLQPQHAFGTTHVAALLLLGADALAQDVRFMAAGNSAKPFVDPSDFDFALLGLCALGSHIRGFAASSLESPADGHAAWLKDSERVLR